MTIENYEVKEYVIEQGERVTNSGFDTSTGWTLPTGWTIADGVAIATAADDGLRRDDTSFTIGKRYRFTYKINSVTAGTFFARVGAVGGSLNGTIHSAPGTYTEDFTYLGTGSIAARVEIRQVSTLTCVAEFLSVVEIPPLKGFDTGTKYLECQTADSASRQSSVAYGEYEFDFYKGGDANTIIVDFIASTKNTTGGDSDGYIFAPVSNEAIQFLRRDSGTPNLLFETASDYIDNNTWYRLKTARLANNGVFKDIQTLQTSDCENSSSLSYSSFTNYGKYGFNAISDGSSTQLAGTADEIVISNTVKYLVEFDLKLNSGTLPYARFGGDFASGSLSDIQYPSNGKNSLVFTASASGTGRLWFRNDSTTTDYTISGLTIRRIYDPGTFAVFINGGIFGEEYTLIDTTGGSGSNPVTDTTHITSKYFVADLDADDSIANIKITNGVKQ